MLSRARIAIIGAGVIGASVADAIAARGAAVTLFDMRAPGQGASQASVGVLSPYIEAKPGSTLLSIGSRSVGMWDDFVTCVRSRAPGLTPGCFSTTTATRRWIICNRIV